MISSRRLAQIARKWMRAAAAGRKRLDSRRGDAAMVLDSDAHPDTIPARKGCFAVYSSDGQRFEVPLSYLKSDIFVELLRLSEDAFGLPGAGRITLPCDSAFTDSVISSLQRRWSQDLARALVTSMAARPCSACMTTPCPLRNQKLVVYGC